MKLKSVNSGEPRFPLGDLVTTPRALMALQVAATPTALLIRHVKGDWGDVSEHDRHQNEFAIKAGLRVLSSYTLATGTKIWVITEADRSATTLLLPEEY